jgi:hypothetical protein
LDPSSKKGLFVGYSETSNPYMVYIAEQRKTIVRRDVKFEEDIASRKSHEPILVTKYEEMEVQKVEPGWPMNSKEVQQLVGVEEETIVPSTSIRRPRWFTRTLMDAQEPRRTFRETIPLKKFPDYMVLVRNIIDFKPSMF